MAKYSVGHGIPSFDDSDRVAFYPEGGAQVVGKRENHRSAKRQLRASGRPTGQGSRRAVGLIVLEDTRKSK